MEEKLKVITIGSARGTSTVIEDTEYYFLYNGYAMFKIQDEFGPCVLPELSLQRKETAENILRASEILTEAAAQACKKHNINDAPVFKKDKYDEFGAMPYMYAALLKACTDAANIGYFREIESEVEEVDLILLKHQKKRGNDEQSTSGTD